MIPKVVLASTHKDTHTCVYFLEGGGVIEHFKKVIEHLPSMHNVVISIFNIRNGRG